MTIKSLQYAKVNKARKTHCEEFVDQKGSVLTKSERDDIDIDHFNKLHRKDLTLEEILSLETDQDVRKIIQQIIFFSIFRFL